MNPRIAVLTARLQQRHGNVRILGQPVRQNAPRGPCPDDDVIERLVALDMGGHVEVSRELILYRCDMVNMSIIVPCGADIIAEKI